MTAMRLVVARATVDIDTAVTAALANFAAGVAVGKVAVVANRAVVAVVADK